MRFSKSMISALSCGRVICVLPSLGDVAWNGMNAHPTSTKHSTIATNRPGLCLAQRTMNHSDMICSGWFLWPNQPIIQFAHQVDRVADVRRQRPRLADHDRPDLRPQAWVRLQPPQLRGRGRLDRLAMTRAMSMTMI